MVKLQASILIFFYPCLLLDSPLAQLLAVRDDILNRVAPAVAQLSLAGLLVNSTSSLALGDDVALGGRLGGVEALADGGDHLEEPDPVEAVEGQVAADVKQGEPDGDRVDAA